MLNELCEGSHHDPLFQIRLQIKIKALACLVYEPAYDPAEFSIA